MSRPLARIAVLGALIPGLAGVSCGPQRGENPGAQRKPVVAVPPVPSRPFEDGYGAGFDLGKRQGIPRGKLPAEEDVEGLAREQASGHSERTARWERGFVEGYLDGWRNVVTGQK